MTIDPLFVICALMLVWAAAVAYTADGSGVDCDGSDGGGDGGGGD